MADLVGKSVIQRTYEAVRETNLFDDIWVATDSDIIQNHITNIGGKVFRSLVKHACGTNRVAECAEKLQADIIINVQGDEPFISSTALKDLVDLFKFDNSKSVDLASLMIKIKSRDDIKNHDVVKVVADLNGRALYFSRSAIPYFQSKGEVFRHVGVYAFRKHALLDFYAQPPTPLELAENIEAIRYLEMGKVMQMKITEFIGIGIDSPEDLERAKALITY